MAGSYNHVTDTADSALASPDEILDMLNNGGDVVETIVEMYGMIWELADALVWESGAPGDMEQIKARVELARLNYKDGLIKSPTKRYKGDG